MNDTIVRIHTDGACSNNKSRKNYGGWGAILEYGSHRKEIFGGIADTTNNQMEMTALLEAFRCLKRDNLTIHVFSDSSYLINCFREKWYNRWKCNGWRTSKGTPVANKDIWEELLKYLNKHSITFYRVKGHVDPNNYNWVNQLYRSYRKYNGLHLTYNEFEHATRQNVIADKLAQKGVDLIRKQAHK